MGNLTVNDASKLPAVPGRQVVAKGKIIRQVREGSRRAALDDLAVGESVFFVAEPGEKASRLQANISSMFRGGESVSQQGLEQRGGMLVFEGELPVSVVRVTRVHDPK
jgi:hypothetical protein